MAQTKSRSTARKSSGQTRSRPRQSQARRNGKSTVSNIASKAKGPVGNIASKAKGPALATGAAAAGLAGGMLIASRRSRPKLFGVVPGPRPGSTMESFGKGLLRASENVGKASENVGALSAEVRRVREGIEAGGADSKRRSPIEVVLEGLTHRRA
jgi:hypothetical protein